MVLWEQGRSQEAEKLLRQVLSSDPDNVDALNSLAWLLAFRNPQGADGAVELIDRAIEKSGASSALIDTRAVALIQAGRPDQAVHELRAAQTADPKYMSLALHLAWAYQSIGKIEEARQAFRQAEQCGLNPAIRDPFERTVIDRLRQQLGGEASQEIKPG